MQKGPLRIYETGHTAEKELPELALVSPRRRVITGGAHVKAASWILSPLEGIPGCRSEVQQFGTAVVGATVGIAVADESVGGATVRGATVGTAVGGATVRGATVGIAVAGATVGTSRGWCISWDSGSRRIGGRCDSERRNSWNSSGR